MPDDNKTIITRKGPSDDLPVLDTAELGFGIDQNRLFVGSNIARTSYPYSNNEVLTELSQTLFSQLHGERMRVGTNRDYHLTFLYPSSNAVAGTVETNVIINSSSTGIAMVSGEATAAISITSEIVGETSIIGSSDVTFTVLASITGDSGRTGSINKNITIMGSGSSALGSLGTINRNIIIERDITGRSGKTGSISAMVTISKDISGRNGKKGTINSVITVGKTISGRGGKAGSVNSVIPVGKTITGRTGKSGLINSAIAVIPTISANTDELFGLSMRESNGTVTINRFNPTWTAFPIRESNGTLTIAYGTSFFGSIAAPVVISSTVIASSVKSGAISAGFSITSVITGSATNDSQSVREANGTVTFNSFPQPWTATTTRDANGAIVVNYGASASIGVINSGMTISPVMSGKAGKIGSISAPVVIGKTITGRSGKAGSISSVFSITPNIAGSVGATNAEPIAREANQTVTVNEFSPSWTPSTTRESNGSVTVIFGIPAVEGSGNSTFMITSAISGTVFVEELEREANGTTTVNDLPQTWTPSMFREEDGTTTLNYSGTVMTGSINPSVVISSASSGRSGKSGSINSNISFTGSASGSIAGSGEPLARESNGTVTANEFPTPWEPTVTRQSNGTTVISSGPVGVSGEISSSVSMTILASGRGGKKGTISQVVTVTPAVSGRSGTSGSINRPIAITASISGDGNGIAPIERETNESVTVNQFQATWEPVISREADGSATVN